MSDTTNRRMKELGEELCKVADDRFSYQYALRMILQRIGLEDEADVLVTLAKDRKFKELDNIVSEYLYKAARGTL